MRGNGTMTRLTSKKITNEYFSDGEYYVDLPFTILYSSIKMKKYEIKNMDIKYKNNELYGSTVIVGHLPIDKIDNNYYCTLKKETKKITDTAFLVSLINLRQSLPEKLFQEFQDIDTLIRIDNNNYTYSAKSIFKNRPSKSNEPSISKKSCRTIISWCNRYIYPYEITPDFIPELLDKNFFAAKNFEQKIKLKNTLTTPQKNVYFWIWDFLMKLHILYLSFILFFKVSGKKESMEALNIKDMWFNDYTAEQCQKVLQNIYQNILLKAIPNFGDIKKEHSHYDAPVMFSAENVFDLAMYILFFFMKFDESTIKQCPICKKFFVPLRRNQKYCHDNIIYDADGKGRTNGTCYPQLAFKRKKAREKSNNS